MSRPTAIQWSRAARKDLRKLAASDRVRVKGAVRRFADGRSVDFRQLRGILQPRFRLRAGDWRVFVKKQAGGFRVMRVLHRREAYRNSAKIRQDVPEAQDVTPVRPAEDPACQCASEGVAG